VAAVLLGGGTSSASGKNITFSPATQIDPKIKVVLQTPGAVTINGTSSLNATVVSGSFATSGAVTLG
jgi:hypothetical protein